MSEEDAQVLVDVGKMLTPKTHSICAPSPVVGITVFKDHVLVACQRAVYVLKDGVLEPLQFLLGEPIRDDGPGVYSQLPHQARQAGARPGSKS